MRRIIGALIAKWFFFVSGFWATCWLFGVDGDVQAYVKLHRASAAASIVCLMVFYYVVWGAESGRVREAFTSAAQAPLETLDRVIAQSHEED